MIETRKHVHHAAKKRAQSREHPFAFSARQTSGEHVNHSRSRSDSQQKGGSEEEKESRGIEHMESYPRVSLLEPGLQFFQRLNPRPIVIAVASRDVK
jgi:hypothetical protein